jgi:hypothetical protein
VEKGVTPLYPTDIRYITDRIIDRVLPHIPEEKRDEAEADLRQEQSDILFEELDQSAYGLEDDKDDD